MVINVYFDVDESEKHVFDHPTSLDEYEIKNTFEDTIRSINTLIIPDDVELELMIIGTAANSLISHDDEILKKLQKSMELSHFNYRIYTNTDVLEDSKIYQSDFFSVKGYPEIRTLGFLYSVMHNYDIIIQIDDDELVRPKYIIKAKQLLEENPDIHLITAPYEKNGTTKITNPDPLKSWGKFSSMDRDLTHLSSDDSLKRTLFGFGGNMIIRSGFAEKMFYPKDVYRGEDFSLLLATRLTYENGNKHCSIRSKQDLFKTYYTPQYDLTIIHQPPYEAKKEFLYYLEKNFKRFIMEWNMFVNQDKFTFEDLKLSSNYLYEMFGYEDMNEKYQLIFDELKEKYPLNDVVELEIEINSYLKEYAKGSSKNRFKDYQMDQANYMGLIKKIKKNLYEKKEKELCINCK